MHTDPFILFGAQHIITLIIAFSAFIFIPFAIKDKSDAFHHTAGISIAVLIFVHEVTNALNAFTFGLPWQEAVPLHLCDMSAISIALYFIYKIKILFNCAFFWGIGGATMAMLTPDIDYQFPHAEFVPFFYGHALVLLGVFFAVICLKERPFFSDVNKVVVISLVLAGVIYVANILLGEGANFWYLMDKPAADTIMNFFPEPPYHLLVTTPVAISVFYLIYLPYVISDALKKS